MEVVLGFIMLMDVVWPFPVFWWFDSPPFLPDEYVGRIPYTGHGFFFSYHKCVVLCMGVSDTHVWAVVRIIMSDIHIINYEYKNTGGTYLRKK